MRVQILDFDPKFKIGDIAYRKDTGEPVVIMAYKVIIYAEGIVFAYQISHNGVCYTEDEVCLATKHEMITIC